MSHRIELYKYIFLGVLLLLSFYFSGSETAIFSLNRLERNSLKETKSIKRKRILVFLLDNQEQLLITILTGNMIVNIFASNIGSEIGEYLFHGKSEFFSIVTITILLLLVGELTPKRIAVNHSKGFTRMISRPLYIIHLLLTPIRFVLNYLSALILNLFNTNINIVEEDKHALIMSAARLGYNQDILLHSEYSMFKSYLAFKDKSAGGVMTPRILLKTISYDITISEVITLIENSSDYVMNSTIILHKDDSDHLYGWTPIVDILECKFEKSKLNEKISILSKNFHIVPQSKRLPTLILELRKEDIDIALLVDEYGGTAGIVWFQDIIQNVLKVFYGSYQGKLDKNKSEKKEIPGTMTIEEFQEFLDIDINSESETVAGFFLEKFGSIPVYGDEIIFHEIKLTVTEVMGNKILKMQLEIRSED